MMKPLLKRLSLSWLFCSPRFARCLFCVLLLFYGNTWFLLIFPSDQLVTLKTYLLPNAYEFSCHYQSDIVPWWPVNTLKSFSNFAFNICLVLEHVIHPREHSVCTREESLSDAEFRDPSISVQSMWLNMTFKYGESSLTLSSTLIFVTCSFKFTYTLKH